MSTDKNCAPCADCPPAPAPVLPRCNVALPDGTYPNATIVVEDGCITGVQAGSLPVYTPDECCPGGSGGGGGADGVDGPPGPPGQNATIAIGEVTSLPPGSAPTVTNTGTAVAAILNFGIPRGADGADGDGATVGVDSSTLNNTLVIADGVIKSLPVQWPPVMLVQAAAVSTPGVTLTAVEDPLTGIVTLTLNLETFVNDLVSDFESQIEALQNQIDTHNTQMIALQTQLVSLQTALLACCPETDLDLDGDGDADPGGEPGVNPQPPVDTA